jgi:hypothetical protein
MAQVCWWHKDAAVAAQRVCTPLRRRRRNASCAVLAPPSCAAAAGAVLRCTTHDCRCDTAPVPHGHHRQLDSTVRAASADLATHEGGHGGQVPGAAADVEEGVAPLELQRLEAHGVDVHGAVKAAAPRAQVCVGVRWRSADSSARQWRARHVHQRWAPAQGESQQAAVAQCRSRALPQVCSAACALPATALPTQLQTRTTASSTCAGSRLTSGGSSGGAAAGRSRPRPPARQAGRRPCRRR